MAEVWKEIPGTEYSVSNEGRMASRKWGKWRILKPYLDRYGYSRGKMRTDSGECRCYVHQFVAEVFLGPRPTPAHQVNHKNGIRANNHVENLEWVTCAENVRHSFDALGRKAPRGEANPVAKVTEAEVREIRVRHAAGETLRAIAADYGIAFSNVSHIAHRRNWGWLP